MESGRGWLVGMIISGWCSSSSGKDSCWTVADQSEPRLCGQQLDLLPLFLLPILSFSTQQSYFMSLMVLFLCRPSCDFSINCSHSTS